ncbi:MAG: FG-GAP repeat protein [Planctomycetes bacterium]|nr:FG-GAP repeat protein [Planctomycetota bacterium]
MMRALSLALAVLPAQDPERPDTFGAAFVSLADVDGDGTPDHAITCTQPVLATWAFSGATGQVLWRADGSVVVSRLGERLLARAENSIRLLSADDARVLKSFELAPSANAVDVALAPLDDVDGDGSDDFVVGNELFSGATMLPLRVLSGPVTTWGLTVSVVGVDDLDGDGASDVAFASPDLQGGWLSFASSRTGACLRVVTDWSWVQMSQSRTGNGPVRTEPRRFQASRFGRSLASAGDIDGDGCGDLLVGAVQPRPSWTAQTWVISGRDASPIGVIEHGADPYAAVASGDFDGDGCADLVFEHRSDMTITISGATGSTLDRRRTGIPVPNDGRVFSTRSTCAIVNAGDADGDGADDVLALVECRDEDTSTGAVWLMRSVTGGVIRRYDLGSALAQSNAQR